MVYARKIVINYLACVLEDWYSFKDTCVSQKIIYWNKNTSIPRDIISNKVKQLKKNYQVLYLISKLII